MMRLLVVAGVCIVLAVSAIIVYFACRSEEGSSSYTQHGYVKASPNRPEGLNFTEVSDGTNTSTMTSTTEADEEEMPTEYYDEDEAETTIDPFRDLFKTLACRLKCSPPRIPDLITCKCRRVSIRNGK